jgi:hypothetical protein
MQDFAFAANAPGLWQRTRAVRAFDRQKLVGTERKAFVGEISVRIRRWRGSAGA